jgi:hypothetical protein
VESRRGRAGVGRAGGRTPGLMPRSPTPGRPRACRFLVGRAVPAAQARPDLLNWIGPGTTPAVPCLGQTKNRATCRVAGPRAACSYMLNN